MKAKVDKETCTGCGLCVDACPDVFELDGGLAIVKVNPVPSASKESCRDAANSCPVNAISIDE
ncbi:MAG: ferredoxin [Kiritimatiellae bacterium]|nr:ferredoxin [Kiritimatiellia bacterium]MDD5522532.1 ferredoxin [Kiritimatiellia bacterium]